jgi:hypothetical protein
MLSSGSDDSPENSPTRTTPSGEEQKGENKASSDHAGDGDAAALNKGKKATPTRRKTPTSQEGIISLLLPPSQNITTSSLHNLP